MQSLSGKATAVPRTGVGSVGNKEPNQFHIALFTGEDVQMGSHDLVCAKEQKCPCQDAIRTFAILGSVFLSVNWTWKRSSLQRLLWALKWVTRCRGWGHEESDFCFVWIAIMAIHICSYSFHVRLKHMFQMMPHITPLEFNYRRHWYQNLEGHFLSFSFLSFFLFSGVKATLVVHSYKTQSLLDYRMRSSPDSWATQWVSTNK